MQTTVMTDQLWHQQAVICFVMLSINFSPRGQYDQQLKLKEESLSDLENKLKHLQVELLYLPHVSFDMRE